MKNFLEIDGNTLKIDDVYTISHNKTPVKLSRKSIKAIEKSSALVKEVVNLGKPVYGINTGFGKLADVTIKSADLKKLQENLILSHSSGAGEVAKEEEVRAAIIVRANSLAKGYSGVRKEVVEKFLEILNKGIYPYVPIFGSLGASGDLAPLSHIALLLLGRGKIVKDKQIVDFSSQLSNYSFEPIYEFYPKEGLALINGTSFEAGISALLIYEAKYLFNVALKSFSMAFEALLGRLDPFDLRIHKVRNSIYQEKVSKEVMNILSESTLVNKGKNVQDAYTLRCMPQVYGAVLENLDYISNFIEREINASTDNPLIFEDGTIVSGGNFHAQPLAFLMDLYAIILTSLSSMIERRINRLLNPNLSHLKPFLANNPGTESGMMILQYLAASLVSMSKVLSHPASVDSIPVSADQEDFVSMGMNAVIKAKNVLENFRKVVAVELIVGAQALEMVIEENKEHMGKGTEEMFSKLRAFVSFAQKDREFSYDVSNVEDALKKHLL